LHTKIIPHPVPAFQKRWVRECGNDGGQEKRNFKKTRKESDFSFYFLHVYVILRTFGGSFEQLPELIAMEDVVKIGNDEEL